jgi:hypothetical protein
MEAVTVSETHMDIDGGHRADWEQIEVAPASEVERLLGVLYRLRNGPDTLTPDGLRIVNDALYPDEEQHG